MLILTTTYFLFQSTLQMLTLNITDIYLYFLLVIQNYIQTTDIWMLNENAFLSIQKLDT